MKNFNLLLQAHIRHAPQSWFQGCTKSSPNNTKSSYSDACLALTWVPQGLHACLKFENHHLSPKIKNIQPCLTVSKATLSALTPAPVHQRTKQKQMLFQIPSLPRTQVLKFCNDPWSFMAAAIVFYLPKRRADKIEGKASVHIEVGYVPKNPVW